MTSPFAEALESAFKEGMAAKKREDQEIESFKFKDGMDILRDPEELPSTKQRYAGSLMFNRNTDVQTMMWMRQFNIPSVSFFIIFQKKIGWIED